MFAFVNSQWTEVYEDPHNLQGSYKSYYAVDSRISRDRLVLRETEIFQVKPAWLPSNPVGTKIVMKIVRRMRAETSYERSAYSPDAVWGEIGDYPERLMVYEAEIVSLSGFEGTHRCGYCEEFSVVNPDEKAPCKGCKRCDWQIWDDPKPVLGPIEKPSWVR